MSSAALAPTGRRVAAVLIDAIIPAAIVGVFSTLGALLTMAIGPIALLFSVLAFLLAVAWLFVYAAMQGGAGSPGQKLMGVRVVDEADGAAPIGFGRALLRTVVFGLGGAVIVGYVSPLFDERRRGWHDKAVKSIVVDTRATTPPPLPGAPAREFHIPPRPPAPQGLAQAEGFLPPRPPAPSAAPTAEARPSVDFGPAPLGDPVDGPREAPAQGGLIAHVPGISPGDPVATEIVPETVVPAAPAPAPDWLAPTPVAAAPTASQVESAHPEPAPEIPAPLAASRHAAPDPVVPVLPDAPDEVDPGTVVGVAPAETEAADDTALGTGQRAYATVVWDDGTRQAVYGRTVFGRNPAPADGARIASVRDDTMSLSKTHFEIVRLVHEIAVIDLHSTNGVVIVRDDERTEVTPGEPAPLRAGDRLEFGDRHARVELPA